MKFAKLISAALALSLAMTTPAFAASKVQPNTVNELVSASQTENDNSDDDLSPTEYARWKQGLKPSAASERSARVATGSSVLLKNDYLEASINGSGTYTMGTTGGNPDNELDDNAKLLFGHPTPWSSFTTIKIDNASYRFTATERSASTDKNIAIQKINNIDVKQTLSFFKNPETGRNDIVKISYDLTNKGSSPANVGTRIMLDTMLGHNDGAPFKIDGVGDCLEEMEFSGSSIPRNWKAFDNINNPSVISSGMFYLDESERPDKVQFAKWLGVYNTMWNYSTSSHDTVTGDSAVAVYFDQKTLAPDETRTVVTYYGLSEFARVVPGLGVIAPQELALNDAKDGYNPNPITVTAYVENTGSVVAKNTPLEIVLTDGMTLVDDSEASITIPEIEAGKTVQHSWNVNVAGQLTAKEFTYKVNLKPANSEAISVDLGLKVPAINKPDVAAVTATPESGEVVTGTTIALNTLTEGATIHYTTDGSEPTATSSTYAAPIEITADTTVKALALHANMNQSPVATFNYTVKQNAAIVTADPASGAIPAGAKVTLSTATSDAVIKYTTDGSEPTASSTPYTEPITITAAQTIKAIATKEGMTNSGVATFDYTLAEKVADVKADLRIGEVENGALVKLSTTTTGATIHFTTDGTTPTESSLTYLVPLEITADMTIKAFAIKEGMSNSDVTSFAYTLEKQVEPVVATPEQGKVATGTEVTLSTKTPGAQIKYTLDNTTPTIYSETYERPIPITATTTITAMATKNEMADSKIETFKYYAISPNSPTVTVSKAKGTSDGEVEVDVTIANNPGFAAFEINLDFDSSILVPKSIKAGKVLLTGLFVSNVNSGDFSNERTLETSFTSPRDIKSNGVMFTVKFAVKDGAVEGKAPITVANDYNITNEYNGDIELFTVDGYAEIISIRYGDIFVDGLVTAKDSLKLAQYLVGDYHVTLTPSMEKAADVYANVKIDTKDALKLAQYLAGWPNVVLGTR